MVREDLRTETLTRWNWRELIKIQTEESEHNLLNKFMLLSYEDFVGAKKLHQSNKISTSRNMYIAIWRTLGPVPKQKIYSYLSKINRDGPILLWYILTLYHGTAAQIIRAQTLKKRAAVCTPLFNQSMLPGVRINKHLIRCTRCWVRRTHLSSIRRCRCRRV